MSDSEQVSSTAAMDALHLLENRLRSTEQELSESKYKVSSLRFKSFNTDVSLLRVLLGFSFWIILVAPLWANAVARFCYVVV